MNRDIDAARRIAMAIAPTLGADWSVFEGDEEWRDWVDLRRSDGATIRVTVGGWKQEGRVVFRGMWPRFADGSAYYGGKGVSITCADSRPVTELVREVRRRFLPAYDHEYAKALAYMTERDSAASEARAVAARISDSIGASLGPDHTRRGDGQAIWNEPGTVRRLRVQPRYTSTVSDHHRDVAVSFEVHDLDPETAGEVLALIKAAEGRRVATSATRIAEEAEELDVDEGVEARRTA